MPHRQILGCIITGPSQKRNGSNGQSYTTLFTKRRAKPNPTNPKPSKRIDPGSGTDVGALDQNPALTDFMTQFVHKVLSELK